MSTAARKARKRFQQMLRAKNDDQRMPFQHPRKEGTPVHLRAENQARPYHLSATISGNRPTRKARAAIAAAEARSAAAGQGTTWPDHRRASRA